MPVVPITTTKGANLDPASMPGDTDTAIAAALLHREGHFDQQTDEPALSSPKTQPVRKRRGL